jgi:hypothetical protein
MYESFDPSDIFSICEVLDASLRDDAEPSAVFSEALNAAIRLIEAGDLESAETVGRVLTHSGPLHNAREAYKWFYIGLSQRGYSTAYENEYESDGTSYLGPIGDFRNEDEVSICIGELGLAILRELDAEAEAWLNSRGLSGR